MAPRTIRPWCPVFALVIGNGLPAAARAKAIGPRAGSSNAWCARINPAAESLRLYQNDTLMA